MKSIFLAILLLGIYCDEFHYFMYTAGTITIDKKDFEPIEGVVEVILLKQVNLTVIAGMNVNSGVHVPFTFVAENTNVVVQGDNVEVISKLIEGEMGSKKLDKITGEFRVKGTWKEAQFEMTATSEGPKASIHLKAQGKTSQCQYYIPTEAARRAAILIGEKAEKYLAVNVLNYAIWAFPYITHVKSCQWYLDKFPTTTETKPGFVVVGKDGKHCGIINKEGDQFIHSNPVKKEVTSNPLTMLKNFFPEGYVIKAYKCPANL